MKTALFSLFGILLNGLLFIVTAGAEEVELSTYYPAPEGEYRELEVTERARLATAAAGTTVIGTPSTVQGAKLELFQDTNNPNAFSLLTRSRVGVAQSDPPRNTFLVKAGGDAESWGEYYVHDVYLKQPRSGPPRWVSQTSGAELGTSNCYNVYASRHSSPKCNAGYYLKALIKSTDGNWDGYGAICCDGAATLGISYNQLVNECRANPSSFGEHGITCPSHDVQN